MRFEEETVSITLVHNNEVVHADVKVAASYPKDLAKIIHGGGYPEQQIFSLVKIALCWKKVPFGYPRGWRRNHCLILKDRLSFK